MLKNVYRISQSVGLPWTYEQYKEHADRNTSYYIVENNGFLSLDMILDEAEIINVAVTPQQQGKGEADDLMNKAKDLMCEKGVKKCFLEVRKSNHRARTYYKKHGFCEIGERKAYYKEPVEDAVVYCWENK